MKYRREMMRMSEIKVVNGKEPKFKKLLDISDNELIKILKKPSCQIETYVVIDGVKTRFESMEDAVDFKRFYENGTSNFLEFELENCHTQDEILQDFFEFMVVLTYNDFHFSLEPYQVNFLKTYQAYRHIFNEKPNKYCVYGNDSYDYNINIDTSMNINNKKEIHLTLAKRFLFTPLIEKTSLYCEVMANQAISEENGIMRVGKNKNFNFHSSFRDAEIIIDNILSKIVELVNGEDVLLLEVEGEKLPPFNNKINHDIQPVENSSRIIRQMATLGRHDIITVNTNYEEMKNTVKYDRLKHEFEGDENRVLHTLPIFQVPIDELSEKTILYDIYDNIIIGNYSDVRAYMENERFKRIKRKGVSGYAIAHMIIGLGNDMVAVFHIKISLDIFTNRYHIGSSPSTAKHALLYFNDGNIVEKMFGKGYVTTHFDTDIHILFNNAIKHINEMADRLDEIGYDTNDDFKFTNSVDGNNFVIYANEEKINHNEMKKLLMKQ